MALPGDSFIQLLGANRGIVTVEAWILRLHVVAGTVALVAGSAALLTKKGGRRHRLAGRLFLRSVAVVVGTVFALLPFGAGTFRLLLTLVAVFSGYLAFSGYRALDRMRPDGSVRPVDWVAAAAVVAACLALGGWGVRWLLDGGEFGVVMVVFGAIGVGFGVADVRRFRGDGGGVRTVAHLQRTLGAFVAVVSAVSAVNLTPLLGVAAWLWPTAVGVPLIAYLSRAYDPRTPH